MDEKTARVYVIERLSKNRYEIWFQDSDGSRKFISRHRRLDIANRQAEHLSDVWHCDCDTYPN